VDSAEPPRVPPAGPVGRVWRSLRDGTTTLVDRLDRAQQRHAVTAVPCAVVRKYSDDRAGRLTAQLSHSAFLSVFPLLLVLLTLVGIVLNGHPALQDDIINSALRQFPVIGTDLKHNIHELSTTNALALVVGLVWLTYGSLKLSRNAQLMMAEVWDVHRDDLPDFAHWIPRAVGFLAILGVGFLAGGALAGLGAFGRLGGASVIVGLAASLGVNVAMYWGGYAVLVRIPPGGGALWPGAVIAGTAWTLLQFAGALLVNHQLRHLSNLYGTFATVLGLIWWLALAAMITVLAAECNVVLTRRLWPRSFRRTRRQRPVPEVPAAEPAA
jgi:YihY family inner membrane protein